MGGDVIVNYENSVFQDFYVEGNAVHFICILEVQNICDQNMYIRITGRSQEDVDNGLLASPELIGNNVQTNDETFSIPASSTLKIEVDFSGTFGNTNQKADRLIPDVIEVETINK